MLRGLITAVSALALTVVPVAAQAAPLPAPRTAAVTEESESMTTTGWILVGIGAVLLVWGIIELTSDDEPESP